MTARIYTPDDIGRCTVCTVCQCPEAEHSRSGGWEGDEARCMPALAEDRIYTPDPDGVCIVCGVDEAEHSEECQTTADVTADTLTRQQIRDHYSTFTNALQRDAEEALAWGLRARPQRVRLAAAINGSIRNHGRLKSRLHHRLGIENCPGSTPHAPAERAARAKETK